MYEGKTSSDIGSRWRLKGELETDLEKEAGTLLKCLADSISGKSQSCQHLQSKPWYKDECWDLVRTNFLLSVLTSLG